MKNYRTHCPICKGVLVNDNGSVHGGSTFSLEKFSCYNPLASDPLHYYHHQVNPVDPDTLAYQEFSVNLGHRYIIFSNHYSLHTSFIKTARGAEPLMIPVLLIPDFPSLEKLKNKIKISMVFS
jgi:hypothetical protein